MAPAGDQRTAAPPPPPPPRREQHVSLLSSFIRWIHLKIYQYEVTFSLYMLTPTEKFIFNLILFVLISMLITAASLYLPNHIAVIYNRIWYYVHGELAYIAGNGNGNGNPAPEVAQQVVRKLASTTSAIAADQILRKATGEL